MPQIALTTLLVCNACVICYVASHIPCCALSKLTWIQLNLLCTLLFIPSRHTLCYQYSDPHFSRVLWEFKSCKNNWRTWTWIIFIKVNWTKKILPEKVVSMNLLFTDDPARVDWQLTTHFAITLPVEFFVEILAIFIFQVLMNEWMKSLFS